MWVFTYHNNRWRLFPLCINIGQVFIHCMHRIAVSWPCPFFMFFIQFSSQFHSHNFKHLESICWHLPISRLDLFSSILQNERFIVIDFHDILRGDVVAVVFKILLIVSWLLFPYLFCHIFYLLKVNKTLNFKIVDILFYNHFRHHFTWGLQSSYQFYSLTWTHYSEYKDITSPLTYQVPVYNVPIKS